MLAYALATRFTFWLEYRDDKKQYHIDQNLTPQSFFEKYVGWNLDDYVSIINAPTDDKPYNHTYTIEMLGNVLGGRSQTFERVYGRLQAMAIKQLQAGQSVVWLWCWSILDRQKGVMATDVYSKDELSTLTFQCRRLNVDYGESLMTHAMVITGVDLVDGQPTKWKVENSWGDKVGTKGFFVMSDAWMDEYCYKLLLTRNSCPMT